MKNYILCAFPAMYSIVVKNMDLEELPSWLSG